MCDKFPGFDAHKAGSDVPTVLRVHSAAADPSLPWVSTVVEAHPARSLCAFADVRSGMYTETDSIRWNNGT